MPEDSTGPAEAPDRAGRRSHAILPGKTLAALVVAAVAIFVSAAVSFQSLEARAAAVAAVNHTNVVRQRLNVFAADLVDAETGQRGFLLTGQEPFLEPYNQARASLPSELAMLRQ